MYMCEAFVLICHTAREKQPSGGSYIMFGAETHTGKNQTPRTLHAGKLPLPALSQDWKPVTVTTRLK